MTTPGTATVPTTPEHLDSRLTCTWRDQPKAALAHGTLAAERGSDAGCVVIRGCLSARTRLARVRTLSALSLSAHDQRAAQDGVFKFSMGRQSDGSSRVATRPDGLPDRRCRDARVVGHGLDAQSRANDRRVVRCAPKLTARDWIESPAVEVIECDLQDEEHLATSMRGCGAAYYLIHSMIIGRI